MTIAKKSFTAALLLLAAMCAPLRAATHTNLIFNVSIGMQTMQQDFIPVTTNSILLTIRNGRFSSQDLVNVIAGTALFQTNNLSGGKLLFRVSDLGPDRTAQFIIRKATNDVDVSSFLQLGFPAGTVTSKAPGPNGTTNATDYTIVSLYLYGGNPAGYFDNDGAQGFATVKNTSVFNGRQLIQAEEFPAVIAANIAGMGYAAGGKRTFFKGTLLLSGRRVEMKTD